MMIQPLRAPIGEPFEWDGHSPIEGAEVTSRVEIAGHLYVFTQNRMYVAEPTSENVKESGVAAPSDAIPNSRADKHT